MPNPVESQLHDHLNSTPAESKDVRLNVLGVNALQDFGFKLDLRPWV